MALRVTLLIALLLLLFTFQLFINCVISTTTFVMVNKCDYTVWPGILSNPDSPTLSTTGFALQKNQSKTITAPTSWGGRIWGRTLCSQDSTGKFSCVTGDCGSNKLECSGSGAAPPTTLAEFKLDGYGGLDYYDVSLVDGYNLPVLVVPQGGTGQNCSTTGCMVDLNGACPWELKVMSEDGKEEVACKSACEAFQQPQYCCNGAYSTPDTCKPSSYSQIFKKACPQAYSYAYDDKSSTFTCASGPAYTITFCPAPNTSQKASQGTKSTDPTSTTTTNSVSPVISSTMVYQGALDQSAASSSYRHVLGSYGMISMTMAIWSVKGLW
ncbi:thaumatin-like protein 1b [Mangifera indica]|uniref:thaumatin-like protein 1b n=1 Tax=Mangifera indica TaxID=29780 RepID=UPI001CFB86F4|nr:thaumatin-like protein 1b [Mangifera indica]